MQMQVEGKDECGVSKDRVAWTGVDEDPVARTSRPRSVVIWTDRYEEEQSTGRKGGELEAGEGS